MVKVLLTTSELRGVTCRMGSLSVTCYPTQVNAPRLNLSHTGCNNQFRNDTGLVPANLYRQAVQYCEAMVKRRNDPSLLRYDDDDDDDEI